MKIAIKNFLTTLRRYKVASVLNIAGLTLAFTAFYVMMVQVTYDLGYNRSIRDADRIWTVNANWIDGGFSMTSPRGPFEAALAQCPEVEGSAVITRRWDIPVWVQEAEFSYTEYAAVMDMLSLPSLDLLGFRTVEGDLRQIENPNTVILPESLARLYGVHAGDRIFTSDTKPGEKPRPSHEWTVVGIYKDFADNTLMGEPRIYSYLGDMDMNDTSQYGYICMVKMRDGSVPDSFKKAWDDNMYRQRVARVRDDDSAQSAEKGDGEDVGGTTAAETDAKYEYLRSDVRLTPLLDVYFDTSLGSGSDHDHGSKSTMLTCLGIAILVVAIALINFVNFFFALIPVRLRAVNICKVFGAPTRTLRWNFLFEAVGLVVCALLLTMYLTIVLPDTFVAEYVSRSLSLKDNLTAVLLLFGIGVVAALAAALYPSYYITSFNASLAVKSGFAGSGAGRRLRLVLVGVQFTVSIALIVVAACFWLQYRYMINYDIGIDRENLMSFNLPYKDAAMYPVLTERMNGMPEIVGVTASVDAVVGNGSAEVIRMKYEGRDLELHFRYVRSNFLDVMGIRLAEGENFTPDMDNAATRYAIFCRSTCDEYGFYPGFVVMAGTEPICRVIGIVDDVLGQPLDSKQSNTVYCTTSEDQWMGDVYFRTAANVDIPRRCDRIRAVAKEINPDSEDLNIELVDEQLQRHYEKTQRSATIIGLFALLAVVISLMGVFGIVLFETQHRRREIALRRVMGSTVEGIVWMFGRHYVTIVAVCFVVAVPVAWYVVSEWLNTFAYRIATPWWIFLAAFLLVTALTMGIVVVRCRRTAGENPARVLGGE